MIENFEIESCYFLRIIARDGGRLDTADRARISHAADELETALRVNALLHIQMHDVSAHKLAMAEEIAELRRRLPPPAPEQSWSHQSGPMPLIGYMVPTR